MAVYATRQDVVLVFGADNVTRWADLDGDRDPVSIESRISYALQTASAELDDVLRGRRYKFPITVSPTVRDLVVRMTALRLYDARGIIDGDPTADKMSVVRATVDKMLGRIRRGEVNLLGESAVSYPTIGADEATPKKSLWPIPDPFKPFRP